MYSVRIIFVVLLCGKGIESKCVFTDFDEKNFPLFSYIFGNKQIYFRPTSPSIVIGEGSEISAYCKSNFTTSIREYQFSEEIFTDKVIISCHKNSLSFATDNIPTLNNINSLRCMQIISLYQAKSSYCDKQMIAIALDVVEQPTFLGGVCYDPESLETKFVHYSTDKKLQHPDLFVFRDAVASTDFFGSSSARTNIINKSLKLNWPKQYQSHSYRFDELVPTKELTQNYSMDTNFITSNMIPWWTHLKDENWKRVEEITNYFTMSGQFDIYTGISHWNGGHTDFDQYLQYAANYKRLQIPLYVWKYIKPKYPSDSHHEVVIIGINFPYLNEYQIRSLQFCSDICDDIYWLRGSLQLRRVPNFGYVFCCKPNDARERIPIIQSIQLAFRNVFQQEP